ncbi:hypothetical protein Tco_1538635 [Tanacetum coccineum]
MRCIVVDPLNSHGIEIAMRSPVFFEFFKVKANFRHEHQGIGATWAHGKIGEKERILDYESAFEQQKVGRLRASVIAGCIGVLCPLDHHD